MHFSDSTNSSTLLSTIARHIDEGASIIDIGGQSTRPYAPEISADAELARITPLLDAIRSVSVDTYRADVARAAIAAGGADIINDVSAGRMDAAMLPTLAELGCTVVLMHMRGTPETMNSLADYPRGVVETVGRELAQRVGEAV